jgi:hypothetical protein
MLYNQPHDFPLPEFKILTATNFLLSIILSMILLLHSYHMCGNLVYVRSGEGMHDAQDKYLSDHLHFPVSPQACVVYPIVPA